MPTPEIIDGRPYAKKTELVNKKSFRATTKDCRLVLQSRSNANWHQGWVAISQPWLPSVRMNAVFRSFLRRNGRENHGLLDDVMECGWVTRCATRSMPVRSDVLDISIAQVVESRACSGFPRKAWSVWRLDRTDKLSVADQYKRSALRCLQTSLPKWNDPAGHFCAFADATNLDKLTLRSPDARALSQ